MKPFQVLSPQSILNTENIVEILPEVAALKGIKQPKKYHAEGDAFIHTCLAVKSLPDNADERVQWAVLLHDIGKAKTTKFIDGRWRSHGHDVAGAKLVAAILLRFNKQAISEDVTWLVRYHHFALSWGIGTTGKLSRKQYRFCQLPLFPLLIQVVRAYAAGSYGISDKGNIVEHILNQLR